MAEVGRQGRDPRLDVIPISIPGEQGTDREGVSQIVQPRRARCTDPDPGTVDEFPEQRLHHLVAQPFAGQGHEEARIVRSRLEPVALTRVVGQSLDGAGV